MNDLDELTQYLHARADAADLGRTPLGVITRAGTRRRNRHRAVTTATVLAAGTLGAVATIQVLSSTDSTGRVSTDPLEIDPVPTALQATVPTTVETSTSGAPAGTGQGPALVDSPLVWNEVTVGSSEAITMFGSDGNRTSAIRGPDGALYQASTLPGRTGFDLTPTWYRSDDGISWTQAEDMMFEGRVPPAAIDGDRLYAISTTAAGAPEDSGRGTLYAATSPDGGENWATTPLPYDLAAVRATPGISEAHVAQRQAAANSRGVVIAAQAHAYVTTQSVAERLAIDPLALQPDNGQGFIERAVTPVDCEELTRAQSEKPDNQVGTMSPDGRCALWGDEIRRHTWADIGFTGDAEAARVGQLLLFHSTDGTTFTRLDPPAVLSDATGEVRLAASANRFLLAVTSAVDEDSSPGWETKVFVSTDGIDWTELPDPGTATCGDVGATFLDDTPVLVVQACRGEPRVLTFRDGAWSATTLSSFPAGMSWTGMAWRSVGPAGIAVAIQVAAGAADSGVENAGPYDLASQRWLLYYSRDGVTWSSVDLGDIVSDMGSQLVTSVRVTDQNVIVTTRTRLDLIGPNDPLPDVTVLVGTLN